MTTARHAGAVLAVLSALWLLVGPAAAQDDPLAPVADRVGAQDDRGARERLDALPEAVRRSPRARYLRGRLLERLGEHAAAARAFEGLGDGLPAPVAEDARWRRGVALARTGRCADGLPLLEPFAAERGDRGAVARALRGQCALVAGELDLAIERLGEAAREDAARVDTFGVRLALADARLRKGDRDGAAAELRSLLVDRPEHPDSEAALAQLAALGRPFEPTAEERLARAARLVDLRRPRDALAELDAGEPPRDRETRARWLHVRGMALFRTRHDYAEAARVLAQAARLGGTTAEQDEFHAARALSRADRDDAAIRAYRRFVRRHPTHRLARDAEYLAAWLELRHGRRAGERSMERFLRGPRAGGAEAREAVWHLGLRAFERRRFRDAAERFERYASLGGAHDAMVRGRGLYWLGRARMEAGDRTGAVRALREALYVEPLHWYALLARERLRQAGEDPGAPFPEAEPRDGAPPLPRPELPPEVAFFASVGLLSDAVAALERHEDAMRDAAPDGRGLEAVVAAYRAVGAASRPYRLVAIREKEELRRRPDAANLWIWEAAYPRPWSSEVERVARDNDLAPEYLWAIMRQESGYDPQAVSYADAIGLLQLLPRTAERVARGQGLALRREMLFDPVWNLRLAAVYNGGLFRTFGRRPPLSIGAFNAGGHRVRSWLDEAPDGTSLDLFVERIPFDQTRGYVRRVTTHLARYLYLRDPEGGWPLDLPLELSD